MLRRRFLNLLNYHNYTFETFNVSVGLRFGNVHNRSCEKLLFYKHKHTLLINKNQYETNKIQEDKVYNSFTYRSHTCGELRAKHNGEKVTLCGWVQYLRLSKFLLLRDSYGMVQCIVKNTNVNFNDIPIESVVLIDGLVVLRPPNMVNSKMNTGEIEIVIDNLKILNIASKLPFNLRDHQKPKEQVRLQHRYVDLRFPEMQNNLRNRSSMLHNMRKFLVEENCFVEIETPTLFCRTPGGAREFVVPTHHPGLFYSLVQSPQQFKQMLMVGGIDRYFQVARCYRDEATRPDRQPEFTQLDIEMSFTNLDNVISLIEQLLYKTFTKQLPNPPFRRMTYNYAIENYGTDKPNLTYDLQLQNISFLFNEGDKTDVSTFVLPYPIEVGNLPAKHKEKIKALKQKYNVRIIFDEYIIKELTSEIRNNIQSIVGEKSLLICMGDKKNVCCCLGDIRQLLGSILQSTGMIKMNECIEPLWVVDFPLFVKGENGLETCHHPFTAPHPSDLHLLETDPLNVRSLAYDIVMNGNEIGGGSVRVHDAELQEKLLQLLNINKFKLAHFIHALRSGCPPHAGIALGIDRLVTLACGADSIRDVIAFPKSHEGKDPLSGAPNVITEDDKNYYHINVTK